MKDKFRVWNGMEMIYDVMVGKFGVFYINPGDKGNGLDPNDSASLTPFNTKYSDDIPVMKVTGLFDKNGKEIWEGDILKCHGAVGVVSWNDDLALFEVVMKIGSEEGTMTIYCHQENGRNVHREVLGNIHMNKDLMTNEDFLCN